MPCLPPHALAHVVGSRAQRWPQHTAPTFHRRPPACRPPPVQPSAGAARHSESGAVCDGTQAGTSAAAGLRCSSSSSPGAFTGSAQLPPPAAPGRLQQWHATTRRLLHLATVATGADVAVRVAEQAAGSPILMACDAWVSLSSSFTSFLILSSVFIVDNEVEAAGCYAAGLAGSLILLVQAYGVPTAVLLAAILLAAGSTAVNALMLQSGSQGSAARSTVAWRLWRGALCATGFAMLPQVFYLSVILPAYGAAGGAAAAAGWGPAAAGLALCAVLALALQAGWLPRSCWEVWDAPAWTATLLFMLEPLAALAAAARDPSFFAAASPATFLLPALVTGLQVPRALLSRDHMWATGTSWSTAFACLQAALAAAATGRVALAAAITAMPVLGAAWLLHGIATAEGHSSPLQSMQPIVAAYKRQLQPWRHVAARLRNSIRRQLAAL